MIRLLLALFVIAFVVMSAAGQTVTSVQDGPWNDGNTWSSGIPPTSSNSSSITILHNVNVPNAFSVTVDQVLVDIGATLTIDAGATFTVADDGTAANDLEFYNDGIDYGFFTVSGTVICNNSATIIGTDQGNTNFNSSSVYRHLYTNTEGSIPIANWAATSTVQIQGYTLAANLTATSGGNWNQSFGNFVFDCTLNNSRSVDFAGFLTSVQNDLTVANTGSSTSASVRFSSSQSTTLNIGRDLIISGSSRVVFATTGTISVNIGRDFTYNSTITTGSNTNSTGTTTIGVARNFGMNASGGQLILASGAGAGNGTLNITGNFTLTAGTITESSTGTGVGNINFVGAATHTFSNSGTISNSINYSVATLSTLDLGTSPATGLGAFTLNGTMRLGSLDGGGALQTGTSGGNVRVSGTRTYATNSSIVYNGGGAQFIGNGFPSGGDVNLTINNSNGVTLSSSLDIVALRVLTLTSGNIIIGSQTLTINGTVAGSGGIVGGATSNLVIGGTGNFGTLTFNGTNQLFNFTLNRTSSGIVTLGGSLSILGTFTHTAGTLAIGSNTLTISGPYGPTNSDDLAVTSASTLVVDGSGTLPSDVGFVGTTLGTLTINRSGATFPTTSSIEITNLNLTSGIFSDGSSVSITPGGTITRSGGSMTSNPSNTTNAYNVVYASGTFSTGPELPSSTTALANLSKTGTGTLTLSSAITVNGVFTLSSGSFNAGSNAIDLKGNFVSNASSTLTSSAITFSGTTTLSGSTAPIFGAITISGTLTPAANFQVNGNMVNNGTLNSGSGTTTFGGNTTISGSSATSLNNITVSGTMVAPALTTLNIGGNFVNNGTFNHNNGTVAFNGTTTVSGSATSNFFNVNITGTLTAPSSAALGVAGNLANAGTFNHNNGTVVFNGTILAQSITGSALTFNNIIVGNPVSPGVSVNNTSRLNGIFTLNSGALFDADGSGSGIFIVSSSSQTAGGMINTLPTPANFTGNVTVERYIHGKTGGDYRYLSMPITNGNLSLWKSSIFVTGSFSDRSTNADNSNISNSGNTNASVFTYNSTTQAYVAVTGSTTTATPISNTTGYSAYDFNNGAVTASYRGTIGKGSINIPISNTTNNFNLVPNPYPAPIDWDNVTKTNVNNAMYIRVDKANVFSSYVGGVVTNAPFVGWTGEVATGQSFFVSSSGTGSTLAFKEGDKTTNGFYFLRTKSPDNYFRIQLASAAGQQDETVIRFLAQATDGMDSEFDALKLKNGDPLSPIPSEQKGSYLNISSYLEKGMTEYSINSLGILSGPKIVRLNLSETTPGEYELNFSDFSTMSLGYKVILVDTYLNEEITVGDDVSYVFKVNADQASTGDSRFYLRINGEAMVTAVEDELAGIKIYPNPVVDLLQINLSSEQESSLKSIELYNIVGSSVTSSATDKSLLIPGPKIIDMKSTASGVYVLYIRYGDRVKSTRIIKK